MPAPALSAAARRASWRVFFLVLLSGAYFYQSAAHNEAARIDQMASLAERGEWWIDSYAGNTADIIRVDGHIYPGKAPGTSLLGAPLWSPLMLAARQFFSDPRQQQSLVAHILTLLMATLPTALVSLLLLRFLQRQGWKVGIATLMALGYGLGSLAFPWSTVLFGHQLSAAFAFGGFYLIWKARWSEGAPTLGLRIGAGLLLGFLPVIEHPGAIATVLIGLYAVATLGPGGSWPFIAAGIVGALPLPLYNLAAFGDPRSLGYGYYAQAGSAFPAHQVGIMGVSWPRWSVLREITFGTQRGLFYANPWLCAILISPICLRRLRTFGREASLCAALVVAFFAFNAGYGDSLVYWGGGYSFGPRHMLIALPFAVILAATPIRTHRQAGWIGGLIGGTALLMFAVTAVDPRFPYEPSEPFLRFYLPLFARGDFSVNASLPFGLVQMFRSMGASNFGRAAGLPHELEMAPLALLWAFAIPALFRVRSRRARAARAAWATLVIAAGMTPALARAFEWRDEGPGLCRTVSSGKLWPGFYPLALQEEPSNEARSTRIVGGLDGTDTGEVFDPRIHPKVAVTYRGHYAPRGEGWYRLRLSAIGKAALYLDGQSQLKIDNATTGRGDVRTQVFLTSGRHEFVLLYMSDQPERRLLVEGAPEGRALEPLREGLTTNGCR